MQNIQCSMQYIPCPIMQIIAILDLFTNSTNIAQTNNYNEVSHDIVLILNFRDHSVITFNRYPQQILSMKLAIIKYVNFLQTLTISDKNIQQLKSKLE